MALVLCTRAETFIQVGDDHLRPMLVHLLQADDVGQPHQAPDVVEQLESECCGISFEGLRVLCPDVEGADSGAPAGGLHLLEKHRLEISQRIRVGVRGGGAGRRSQLHGDKQCKLMLAKD